MSVTLRENLHMHTRKPELKSDIISHQLLLIKIMGPPTNSSQDELRLICNEYLTSLQVTVEQATELARETVDQDASLNSLW